MSNQNRQKWIDALRSGKYTQCKWTFRALSDDRKTIAYCAIGLAAELLNTFDEEGCVVWSELKQHLQIDNDTLEVIMAFNDNSWSFEEIATAIEKLP